MFMAANTQRRVRLLAVCGTLVLFITVLAVVLAAHGPAILADASRQFLLPGYLLVTFLSRNPHIGFHDWRNDAVGGIGTWIFWMLPAFALVWFITRRSITR